MRHQHLGLAAVSSALALLAACAGGIPLHESDQQVRDRYSAYAGEPIDYFTWLGRYDGWEPIGRDELVVFTGVSDAYLIKLGPPCDNLQFAKRIGLTSTAAAVHSRFDSVIVGQWRCPIDEIRKVDYKRMKADLRLEAQSRKAKAAQ
jgi:Family of unknown function (DUF6491)